MLRFVRSISAIALLATGPVWAQVYKWVDDKGVVNYSSRPPAARKYGQLDPNSVSVSVYTPAQTLSTAAGPPMAPNEKALAERIASLEKNLDAERYARLSLAASQAAAMDDMQYERCLRDRRTDCDSVGVDPYAIYSPTVVVFRPYRIARPPKPGRAFPPMGAPSRAQNHRISVGARTTPSGIRRPHGRTGDLL